MFNIVFARILVQLIFRSQLLHVTCVCCVVNSCRLITTSHVEFTILFRVHKVCPVIRVWCLLTGRQGCYNTPQVTHWQQKDMFLLWLRWVALWCLVLSVQLRLCHIDQVFASVTHNTQELNCNAVLMSPSFELIQRDETRLLANKIFVLFCMVDQYS